MWICEVPYGGILFINNWVPHRSLKNHSDKFILRWQDPSKPNGFIDCVVMHKADNPNYTYVIAWSKFASTDRRELQNKDVSKT